MNNYSYSLFELHDIKEFPLLIEKYPDLRGLNVTIPYKESVMHHLDQISPEATAVGAVNTIAIKNGKTIGYNTDVFGFEQSLLSFLLEGTNIQALILGTGGAAKAVQYVLKKHTITYQLVSRNKPNCLHYTDITPDVLRQHPLIINTTPLGMFPFVESCTPIPYSVLTPNHFLFDLVYNPSMTLFLKKGQEAGSNIKNGLEMLHLQADKAWEIWNSR